MTKHNLSIYMFGGNKNTDERLRAESGKINGQ
jgi:hypothetical protein